MGFLAVGTLVVLLIVGAIVQLLVQLIPYVVLGAGIIVAARALHRRAGPRNPYRAPASGRGQRSGASRGPRGQETALPQGWVMVPVWVGPRPAHPVIDGEVIEDDDRGW
ncbi:hypothetical protein BST20_06615 [Mycobacterium branderi]|uniref:Uncharacterized protein n=2 Tax=Mycobacterium branderi TaxID=43348 RepID=A0A7I7WDC0_9MYCO|nr:hypothetical protein BST20_06615 [Mycobacterium branderi]BBZ15526.1 hypothetical protein MBRA_57210 [Mycobacterium branderi]